MEIKTFRREPVSFEAVKLVKNTDIEELIEYSNRCTGDSIEGMGWEYRFKDTFVGIMRNGVRAWFHNNEKIAVEAWYGEYWIVFGPPGTFYVQTGLSDSDTYLPIKPGGHLHWWEDSPGHYYAKIDEEHLFHVFYGDDWNWQTLIEFEENGEVASKSINYNDDFYDTLDDAKAGCASFLGSLIAAHFKEKAE